MWIIKKHRQTTYYISLRHLVHLINYLHDSLTSEHVRGCRQDNMHTVNHNRHHAKLSTTEAWWMLRRVAPSCDYAWEIIRMSVLVMQSWTKWKILDPDTESLDIWLLNMQLLSIDFHEVSRSFIHYGALRVPSSCHVKWLDVLNAFWPPDTYVSGLMFYHSDSSFFLLLLSFFAA